MPIQAGGLVVPTPPNLTLPTVVILTYFPFVYIRDTPVPAAVESWSTT